MPRELFRVSVDEAGDRGWGGRSSPVFVISAVIVRDAESVVLREMLDRINDDLGKPHTTVLHWAENVKTHPQRKHVAREIAASPATISNVVVMKQAMMGSGTHLSDATAMYNYAIRRLLERVSWYVDELGGEAIVTFAHIRRFPYARLLSYLEILKLQPTEIRWDAIRKVKINQPSRARPLQVADLAAGCLYSAVAPDQFGAYEPGYLDDLIPRIYIRGGGQVTSYGMNIVGPRDAPSATFPWWADFLEACAKR
jgi:hypothetical protein